jgi:hypothetical protein
MIRKSFENDDCLDVNGTSFKGYVKTDYSTLVEKFGEPTLVDDLDKSTVEWHIKFQIPIEDYGMGDIDDYDTVVAVIYDWKVNNTPHGEYNWHVGGFSYEAVELVEGVLKGS